MVFVASSFNERDFFPFATVLFRRKDTYGVFAEPVDPEEVRAPNPYSFAMFLGVAILFGRELLSIDRGY
jgi:hypothetical protein